MARSREEDELIKEIYNVEKLESWSKLECFKKDPYEFYLKYIMKIKPDKNDSSGYLLYGSFVHDLLEKLYKGEIKTNEEMVEKWTDYFLLQSLSGVGFMTQDQDRNINIGDKYNKNITHFLTNYTKTPNQSQTTESTVVTKVGDYVFRGYIDFMFYSHNNCDGKNFITIEDFKTSSKFSKEHLQQAKGQLLLYAEGIRQTKLMPYEDIRCRWNMLKYVNVQCESIKGIWKTRQIERYEIGEKLRSSVKTWLKQDKSLSELDIEYRLDVIALENNLGSLPSDIQSHFKISECYIEIEVTKEEVGEFIEGVKETLRKIDVLTKEDKANDCNGEVFMWEVAKSDEFTLNMLGAYTSKYHKPLAIWEDKLKQERDIFISVQEEPDIGTEFDDFFKN